MLAALSLNGLDAPWVIDGAVNGAIFPCWVSDVLCPTLQPGDIVLWDNLSARKVTPMDKVLSSSKCSRWTRHQGRGHLSAGRKDWPWQHRC